MSRTWSQTVANLLRRPTTIKLELSVYGKLPIYKEFLKHNIGTKEAQAFKKWLDEGMGHYWPLQPECKSTTIASHGFVMTFPSAKRTVFGVLWGSHDEGGLRSFPFAVFSTWPRPTGFLPALQVLEILRQLATKVVALRPDLDTADSPSQAIGKVAEIDSRYELRRPEVMLEELAEAFSGLTTDDFARSLYGDSADERWPALLRYLKSRLDSTPTLGGLRLPSSSEISPWLALVVWRSLFDRLGNGNLNPMQLFLPVDTETPSGPVVFFHPPRPDDVYALCPSMTEYDLLEDLRETVPDVGDGEDDRDDDRVSRIEKLSELVASST